MVGLSVHESGGGGYLVLGRWVARATTTWAHASAPRWGETWARSIKIPRFLAVLGGWAYFLRLPWQCQGDLWVWSLGLFSPIFFLHIHKQKKLIKKEYCRCGPHPLQVISSRARPPLVKGAGCLAAFSRISGVGHSCSWPPLHCGDSKNLAREVVPGASLHSEALSPECGREHQETGDQLGPTRHVGARLRGLLGPTAHGLLGQRHPGPRLSHMVG